MVANAQAPTSALNAQRGGIALQPADDVAARMADVGFEGGWYRGGPEIVDGRMSGPWYTRSADEAADYARRFGTGSDVREYAIPKRGFIDLNKSYDSRLARDLASKVAGTPKGDQLASMLRQYGDGERVNGVELWMGLKNNIGEDGAINALRSLGFGGAKGINSPDYVRLFPGTVARDAKRAAFDPAKIKAGVDDIYGAITPGAAALAAGAAGSGLLALRRNRGDE